MIRPAQPEREFMERPRRPRFDRKQTIVAVVIVAAGLFVAFEPYVTGYRIGELFLSADENYEQCTSPDAEPETLVSACSAFLESKPSGQSPSRIARAHDNRGRAHVLLDNKDAAIVDFDAAIEADPGNAAFHFHRGILWHERDEPIRAIADFDKAERGGVSDLNLYISRSEALVETGDFPRAIADLRKAEGMMPEITMWFKAAFLNSEEFLKSEDFRVYLSNINRLGNLRQAIPGKMKSQAQARISGNDWRGAIEVYGLLIRFSPTEDSYRLERARILHRFDLHSEALADYDDLVERNPKYGRYYAYRAKLHSDMGAPAKAIADYRQATYYDPRNYNGYNRLAWVLATTRNPDVRDGKAAVEAAKEAYRMRANAYIRDTLATAYAAAGNFSAAVREQRAALTEVGPSDRSAFEKRLRLFEQGRAIFCPGGPECN
jgi:tetratricopeptide (TPR) repeat protein